VKAESSYPAASVKVESSALRLECSHLLVFVAVGLAPKGIVAKAFAVGLAPEDVMAVSLAKAFIEALAPEGIVAVTGVSFVQAFVAVELARDGIVAVASMSFVQVFVAVGLARDRRR